MGVSTVVSQLPVYDLLDGVAVMEFWDIIRLSLKKSRCEGCKELW